jgi:hypothetical protein
LKNEKYKRRIVIKEDDHILQGERKREKNHIIKKRKSMFHSINDVPNP